LGGICYIASLIFTSFNLKFSFKGRGVAKKKKDFTSIKVSPSRESESLDRYLQEIGKESLITPDEEVRLAKLIQAGNQRALESLTKSRILDLL